MRYNSNGPQKTGISFGRYIFDLPAALGFVASGSCMGYFVLMSHSPDRYTLLGAWVAMIAAVLKQSITIANAPTQALVIPPGNTAVPIINGDGTQVGKVSMTPLLSTDKTSTGGNP
jgi:hypothetical protein